MEALGSKKVKYEDKQVWFIILRKPVNKVLVHSERLREDYEGSSYGRRQARQVKQLFFILRNTDNTNNHR